MSPDDLERCETRADLVDSDGQRAAVVGTYRQIDVGKTRPGDDSTPEYQGHAGVELPDGPTVHLEPTYSEDAIRDDEEIDRFEGERVRAVGTLHVEPPEPDPLVAYVTAPCVSPVERVDPLE